MVKDDTPNSASTVGAADMDAIAQLAFGAVSAASSGESGVFPTFASTFSVGGFG